MTPSFVRVHFSEAQRRRHKWRNLFHSLLLLAGMALILALCGYALWGGEGVWWALAGGALAFLLSPQIPPEWVMRAYGARRVEGGVLPQVEALLATLAARAELPRVPALYWVPSRVLNAFAVGRPGRASIAVTDGLLRSLTLRELAGVLAHEVSHIRNDDLWLMQLADVMSRVTSLMSWLGQLLFLFNLPLALVGRATISWLLVFVLVFAPTLMALLQLALSRAREFDADLDAAALTGDPAGLASALAKLERLQGRFWEEIFFPGRRIPEPSLLRTHPPTEERIRRLLSLYEVEATPLVPEEPLHLPEFLPPIGHGPRFRRFGLWY